MRKIDSRTRTLLVLVGIVSTMGAASFAAVPFYNWFCRVTGYAGETSVAESSDGIQVLDKTIKIRFDGNVEKGMPWQFKPEVNEVTLRIGETGLAYFKATNTSNRTVAGTASYNVAPFSAGGYFTKIQCFCFTEQVLKPGETVDMPVTFYVDPEIMDDIEAKYVTAITLSYTFYETELPDAEAAQAPAEDTGRDVN